MIISNNPSRHTGVGRYPDDYRFPTQVEPYLGLAVPRKSPQAARFVRFAERVLLLETGLRRYDAVFSNGLFGLIGLRDFLSG